MTIDGKFVQCMKEREKSMLWFSDFPLKNEKPPLSCFR